LRDPRPRHLVRGSGRLNRRRLETDREPYLADNLPRPARQSGGQDVGADEESKVVAETLPC